MPLTNDLAGGTYPVEIGVYDGKSGERLLLPGGEGRLWWSDAVGVN